MAMRFPGTAGNTFRVNVSASPGRSAASFAAQPRTDIALGARVFHDKFGYGCVTGQEGNKLTIEFEKAGEKRVLDSFVSLAD